MVADLWACSRGRLGLEEFQRRHGYHGPNAGEMAESGEAGIGRMAELGIRSGCRLQVLQPGSPCLLDIGGCRLSLRGECACQVFVRPLAEST